MGRRRRSLTSSRLQFVAHDQAGSSVLTQVPMATTVRWMRTARGIGFGSRTWHEIFSSHGWAVYYLEQGRRIAFVRWYCRGKAT